MICQLLLRLQRGEIRFFWQKTSRCHPTPSNDRIHIELIFETEKDSMYLVLKTTQNDENVHNHF